MTNPNFDSLSSQTTFAPPIQSPYDSLARLARQKQKLAAEDAEFERMVEKILKEEFPTADIPQRKVNAETLSQSPVTRIGTGFVDNVRDVISGVSDFFVSMFAPSQVKKEVSSEEAAADEQRKALRFFLESDENWLVAGDPTILPMEIPDEALQALKDSQDSHRDTPQSPTPFGGGGPISPSASEKISTIADSEGQTIEGGGIAFTETSPAGGEVSSVPQASSDTGESLNPESSESQGVIAKVKKAIGSLASTIGNAIKAGFLRILSWF